jgi:hypothetical protein
MISASDELKIFENIMAQSPDGLGDPQLLGKFAKAKAQLHALDSFNQMNTAPIMPNQGVTAPISAPVDTSTPLAGNPSNMPQNQPTAQGGNPELNLPQ